MALINGHFALDDLCIQIHNESIVNLNDDLVVIQYTFDVQIRAHVMIGHFCELKLNNIMATSDVNLIALLRENKDKFIIVYDGENFVEFVINGLFQYIKYANEYLYLQMKIFKFA